MILLFIVCCLVIALGVMVGMLLKKFNQLIVTITVLERNVEGITGTIRHDMALMRDELDRAHRETRDDLGVNFQRLNESLGGYIREIAVAQNMQLDTFSKQIGMLTNVNEQKLDAVRGAVEQGLQAMQKDNADKLEKMRATVDEKLHATLEQRLGESFQLVSEKLESVHRGLGEMQHLAANVGDLKKVLTNVKTRGTWGEVQLGNLLEQILTKEQYAQNVVTKNGSNDRVEFAIKLPGKEHEIWLPIDAKFPQEDYHRLVDAEERGNFEEAEAASKQLEQTLREEAKTISEKYLDPPYTTDFAIMFLPTEGLYAEMLRKQASCDTIQRTHRVLVAGPTTLAALLNSLQMGFRTLAIEKRTSEVWELLRSVKYEFGNFGIALEKTKKKLDEAQHSIDDAAKKTRKIERKLSDVQLVTQTEDSELVSAVGYTPSADELL